MISPTVVCSAPEKHDAMLFESFFLAGFECSTHRRRDRRRVDIIRDTQHDVLAERDYHTVNKLGLRTVRDGIRWHLIESRPGRYDWSSVLPMIRAARRAGVQVIWDLFHYGWPDDLDIFTPAFVARFGKLARAFAGLIKNETDQTCFFAPVNEPSFVSWAGGDEGFIYPFAKGRDWDIKTQLIRAAIEAIENIWEVIPGARIVQCEPAIHIEPNPKRPDDAEPAEQYRRAQFQALDMLVGNVAPELGGRREYLDILGLNFYYNNEWVNFGETLYAFHPKYRPLQNIIQEFYDRYRRPLFLSETGIEGMFRPAWLAYVCAEVRCALDRGVPVEGICLYPIANHPGWENERHCHNGLLDYPDEFGNREMYTPLARELKYQQLIFEHFFESDLAADRQYA